MSGIEIFTIALSVGFFVINLAFTLVLAFSAKRDSTSIQKSVGVIDSFSTRMIDRLIAHTEQLSSAQSKLLESSFTLIANKKGPEYVEENKEVITETIEAIRNSITVEEIFGEPPSLDDE